MPKIDLDGVAARLEAIRDVMNVGKSNFAESIGLDPSSYSKVISGQKPLKLDYGFALSEVWGVSIDFIYRGDFARLPDDMRRKMIARLSQNAL
jgi:transcriptional regulator with XRE-family HTH domain